MPTIACVEKFDRRAMAHCLNFGKSVADNGWGMFVTFLEYKLGEQGKKLVKVDKLFAGSQICNIYGYKNCETKNLSQIVGLFRMWYHHDRDINAAINIRKESMPIVKA